MGSNKKELRRLIKIYEKQIFCRKFPKKLCDYIFYELDGYAPWPYEVPEDEEFSRIGGMAASFFAGTLDMTMKEPLLLAEEHIVYLREIYGDAMREQIRLESRISAMEKELSDNGIHVISVYDEEQNGYVDKYYRFDDPEYLKLVDRFTAHVAQEELPFT